MNERTNIQSDPILMDPLALSARGEYRREEMLTALHGAMQSRKRRRTVVRTTSAAASLCLIAACGWLAFRAAPAPSSKPIATDDRREAIPEVLPQTQPQTRLTQIVTTDPTILARLGAKPEASRVEQIGDRELIEALRQTGQNVGLSRIGTEVRLVANSSR